MRRTHSRTGHGLTNLYLGQIAHQLYLINWRIFKMAGELERVEAALVPMADAVQAGIRLLRELAELVRQNATDPARLTAIAVEIETKAEDLAAAVVANTPAAPEPPAPPV